MRAQASDALAVGLERGCGRLLLERPRGACGSVVWRGGGRGGPSGRVVRLVAHLVLARTESAAMAGLCVVLQQEVSGSGILRNTAGRYWRCGGQRGWCRSASAPLDEWCRCAREAWEAWSGGAGFVACGCQTACAVIWCRQAGSRCAVRHAYAEEAGISGHCVCGCRGPDACSAGVDGVTAP